MEVVYRIDERQEMLAAGEEGMSEITCDMSQLHLTQNSDESTELEPSPTTSTQESTIFCKNDGNMFDSSGPGVSKPPTKSTTSQIPLQASVVEHNVSGLSEAEIQRAKAEAEPANEARKVEVEEEVEEKEEMDGIVWIRPWFRWEPIWPDDVPKEEDIVKELSKDGSHHTIAWLGEGSFNKAFEVSTEPTSSILRVALPVDPVTKVTSEVATLNYIARTTNKIPVPTVYSWNATRANDIGFEYIVQEKMPGVQAYEALEVIPFTAKLRLADELAVAMAELLNCPLRGIGSIKSCSSLSASANTPDGGDLVFGDVTIGKIVMLSFVMKDRHITEQFRAPFRSSNSFLHALLSSQEAQIQAKAAADPPQDYTAEDKRKRSERIASLVQTINRLRSVIDRCSAPLPIGETEQTYLWHEDVSLANLLVLSTDTQVLENAEHTLSAILDWEFSAVVPAWLAFDYPKLFDDEDLECYKSCPKPEHFRLPSDGGPSRAYLHAMTDHELWQMKERWRTTMEKLRPGWTAVHKSTVTQRRLYKAIKQLQHGTYYLDEINSFVDELSQN